MLFLKLTVGLSFIAVFISLCTTVFFAITSRRSVAAHGRHEKWATISVRLAIGAVIVTEIMVRFNEGIKNMTLTVVHLCFAVPFLVSLLILRYWVTGFRSAVNHRFLGYTCFFMYLGTFVTGMMLLVRV